MKENFPGPVLRDLVYPPGLVPTLIDAYGTRYPEWLAANPTVATRPEAVRLLHRPLLSLANEALVKYGDVGVLEALFALDTHESGAVITAGLARTILDYWYLDPDRYWRVDAVLGDKGPYQGNGERRPRSAVCVRREVAEEPQRNRRDAGVLLEDPGGFVRHSREVTFDAVRDELPRLLGTGETPQSREAWLVFINLVFTTPTATLASLVEAAIALSTND